MLKAVSGILLCSGLAVCMGAEIALADTPNLNDGLICVAGKAGKKGGYYFYTSTIDKASLAQKQPVSVTILQKQITETDTNLLIIDKTKKTVTFTDIAAESISNPEAQIVDNAKTTFVGKNTFLGKTGKGSPIGFALSPDYSKIKIKLDGKTYSGKCQ
jgi:hypothetical protein